MKQLCEMREKDYVSQEKVSKILQPLSINQNSIYHENNFYVSFFAILMKLNSIFSIFQLTFTQFYKVTKEQSSLKIIILCFYHNPIFLLFQISRIFQTCSSAPIHLRDIILKSKCTMLNNGNASPFWFIYFILQT